MALPESYSGKAEIGSFFPPGLDSASTENKKTHFLKDQSHEFCV